MLCRMLQVSRSGYYSWKKNGKSAMAEENKKLIPLVKELHRESGETYGERRMAKALQSYGINCGRKRAGTIMKLAGVSPKQKKKFKATTDSNHNLPVAPNLLKRNFDVSEPNRVWASDISYQWTDEGWLYLAVVMDLFNREIVGWSMSTRINRKLVMDALQMGFWRKRPSPGLVFHSDRGSQYCSHDFQDLLKAYGIRSSMSRKGDCWDNSVVESFFGSLKTERVLHRRYSTREEARRDIFDYIEVFYNNIRMHSYLGYLSPREFEKQWVLKKAA